MKKRQNFEMVAGDSKTIEYTIAGADGAPFDLAGCSIIWAMSKLRFDGRHSTATITKHSSDGGINVVDELNGIINIYLAPDDTKGISGSFYHELEITNGDLVVTAAIGTIIFLPALIN